jgi:hypothetical protein
MITKTHGGGKEINPNPGQWEWQIGNQQFSEKQYYSLSQAENWNYEKRWPCS